MVRLNSNEVLRSRRSGRSRLATVPAGLVLSVSLSACLANAPLGDPPTPADIVYVAKRAHQNEFAQAPRNLRIGQLHRVQMFPTSEEFLVCVSSDRKTQGPTFDNAGNLLAPTGTTFRQSYAMHMRDYDDTGWGSGMYRFVESGKMGAIEMRDYCPASTRPW